MRHLVLVLALCGCSTQLVELFPGDGGTATTDLTTAPDFQKACVCRFTPCRLTSDCTSTIGAGSTCDVSTFVCSGAVSNCSTASDCDSLGAAGSWICATSATSTASCP